MAGHLNSEGLRSVFGVTYYPELRDDAERTGPLPPITGRLPILVVDDKEENRRAACNVLTKYPEAKVVVATNFADASRMLQTEAFAFCLFDSEMPETSQDPGTIGFFGKTLAALAERAHTPWTILTAGVDEEQDEGTFMMASLYPERFMEFRDVKTNEQIWEKAYRLLRFENPDIELSYQARARYVRAIGRVLLKEESNDT